MKGNDHMVPSSKRKANDYGNVEICTSADKVGSNDDLLIEIVLRLPALSLVLFKSVSKRWLSLITDRKFTLLRRKNPNVDPPSGLLLQASPVFAYVPLNSMTPVKISPLISSNFSFDVNLGYIEVLQSCNGLMLCFGRPDKYYVYNPTINLYRLLPPPTHYELDRFIYGMAIAFDPALSPHYKVLYPLNNLRDHGIRDRLVIYSSETSNWNVCAQTFNWGYFWGFHNCIYWHDAIHWIDLSGDIFHFNLDMVNPHFIEVETPGTLNDEACKRNILSVSCDCLLLLQAVQPRSSLQMNLYEMQNDYSEWSLKYHVNLNHITPKDFDFMPGEPYFSVLCIVLGIGDEEPFLVLEVPGMLIRYNIISKTFYELFELQPVHPLRTGLCSFLFTPSLAGV